MLEIELNANIAECYGKVLREYTALYSMPYDSVPQLDCDNNLTVTSYTSSSIKGILSFIEQSRTSLNSLNDLKILVSVLEDIESAVSILRK